MKVKAWCVLLTVLFIVIPAGYVFAFAPNQETSVVSLIITSQNVTVSKDPDFELLDLGDNVLVPVNAVSTQLELEIDLKRDQNIVLITSKRFNRKAELDINGGRYIVEVQGAWQEQPPVVLNSDFYISPRLIEYLAGVKITWNSKYQELTIAGDWMAPPGKIPAADTGWTNQLTMMQTSVSEPAPREGPACSIGTIEYKLVTELRDDLSGNQTQNGVLSIRGDGRAGPWTISTETDMGYDRLKDGPYSELTRICGKYEDETKTVIIGDSEVELIQTLGLKDLRGITYRNSEPKYQSKLYAFTTVSGNAVPGDKVKLMVNGELIRELSVQDQYTYIFTDIPLRLKRINIVTVIIEKSNGQSVEEVKKIAAFPRLLFEGDQEYLLAYGDYRQPGIEYWEGRALAVKMNYGLADGATFNCEITRITPYDFLGIDNGTIDSGDLGFAFRVGDGLIYTVDWLVSGRETGEPLENGWETSILAEMEHGSFEVVAFCIPDELTKGFRHLSPGRGLNFLDEMELSQHQVLAVSGSMLEPVSEDNAASSKEFELKYIDTSTKDIQTVKSLALQKNSYRNTYGSQEQLGLIGEYSLKKKDLAVKANLTLLSSEITGSDTTFNWKMAGLDFSFLKSAGKSWLFGACFSPAESWYDGVSCARACGEFSYVAEAELKWAAKNTWISMAGSVGVDKFNEETLTGITSQKFTGTVSHSLMNTLSANYHYEYIMDQLNCAYATNEFRFNYRPLSNNFRVWGDIKYVLPMGEWYQPQWSYSSGIQINFKSGLELLLEAERLYDTFWSSEATDVIRLTMQQGIGFNRGQLRTFRYSDDENLSFISGTVFLDENGNGKMDRNEPGIAGIKISLDGSEAVANDFGVYMFNSVEPGIYRANFSLKSLPADYTPKTGEQLIKIKPSENMILDFGLTLNGSISGKVLLDSNANGRIDIDEQPVSWVGILLDDEQKIYTSDKGEFYFENVPLGEHTVKVIPETLPRGMKVSGNDSYHVLIKKDSLDVNNILIQLVFNYIEESNQ